MKIFSKEQIYEGDRLTAERQNIASTELMERAGTQIFNWMHMRMQGAQVPIHVFCGIGNNGGDGLVVARHLTTHGYDVRTYIVNYSDKRSKDFLINYERIKETTKNWPTLLGPKDELSNIQPQDIIIDAVFGIGLNRPPAEWVVKLFQHFRDSKAFTLSIDIPSGLKTDKVPENDKHVVWASYTLSFQSPKLVFFLPDTSKYTVQWEVLDIGIDREFLISTQTEVELIGKHEVLPIYKPRDKFAHKGTFGHTLIIGGSYGKVGAVTLASRGALTIGSGLITAFVPKCGYIPLQSSFPEAMIITDEEDKLISNINFDILPNAIGLGVGLGQGEKTALAIKSFLEKNNAPLVIDADGINIISKNKDLLNLLPENTVLTPHAKELERLVGAWSDDFQKLEKVKKLSKDHDLVVVLKGANSMTVSGDKLYINSSGNPGLATAGTGDVLTGVISGLIAQGYDALSASVFGVYLHGKAGDIAVEELGYQSLIASNVIETLGEAYISLFEEEQQQEINENTTNESE